MARTLVSLRRTVAPDRKPGYDAAWAALAAAAAARDAHAWRFVSVENPSMHLEFLEFRSDADPRADEAVRSALHLLNERATPAVTEEWEED